ncbi:hypothetical protein SAMN05444141_102458 [Pseudovibrio denitrificans]|uniref:Polyketide cyclase / dehydrase and lipid transport n=1 Tax=Pseudovibrio denitrificans TaxID=258256 RepID=A0A1I6ZM70_9HYPH|nr:hypothetical protein [Pseudovibrio denitrificans]SFT63731.1 hypothetical protein SAMN05444141_102458 [Pseudovibrio denitrificans]
MKQYKKLNFLSLAARMHASLVALMGCTVLLSSSFTTIAQANSTISESLLYQPHTLHNGWRKDVDALTHFTGMFCPDYISQLSRSALVPDLKELGTGCVYETENGEIKVIFRRHKKDTAATLINNFKSGYRQSHFKPLNLKTPQNEVAFRTETTMNMGRVESFVAYTAPSADYTVWTSISDDLPVSELEKIRALFKSLAVRIEKEQQRN